jgi:hypothetical protein
MQNLETNLNLKNKMENLENNKLIAEFMGFELQTNPKERWFGQYFTIPNEAWSNRIELLHFDTDWNWLMQVVEKIENLGYDVVIKYNICTITNGENEFQNEVGQKIYATHQTVIEFIKWYNKNK